MCLELTYAIAIAGVNCCLEGLRPGYLPSVISWLIFRSCFCTLAHVEEEARCLGGVLASWKHRLVLLVFNALAAERRPGASPGKGNATEGKKAELDS